MVTSPSALFVYPVCGEPNSTKLIPEGWGLQLDADQALAIPLKSANQTSPFPPRHWINRGSDALPGLGIDI